MKYSIIIPRKEIAAAAEAIATMTTEFGGCTVQSAEGFWINPHPRENADPDETTAECEPVVIVWSFCAEHIDGYAVMNDLAERVKITAEQESVLWWAELGHGHFV